MNTASPVPSAPSDALPYGLAMACDTGLMCCAAYVMILLADLEADYVNPWDFCSRVNQYAVPETLVHGVLTLCFLLSGEYAVCLVNVPLLCYHTYRWATNTHLHFATDAIRTMDKQRQESNARFGFYLSCLFYYAYRFLTAMYNPR